MKKSLIALLVVLALVVTVSAFSVSAEETVVPAPASADYTLTITDGVATAACPCEEHKGATATFTAWTAMPTAAGHYYLADDFSVATQQAFPAANVVLHLNGHSYQRTGQGAALAAYANAKITILDNPSNEGSIKDRDPSGAVANTWGGYGGIIQIANNNTKLSIYGGTYELTETLKDVNGAIIGVSKAGCEVNIYGGNYTGTVSANGLGGVFAVSAGTLNIYGGTITGSAKQGGAIYATGANSIINIEGGTIQNGTSTDRGGNICIVSSAKATIENATVTGGTVTGGILCGGNIYVETGCLLTVNDGALITKGKITTAGSYGGGNIGIRGTGQMVMNGGTISEGSHAGKGGNIFKENGGKVTLNGGTVTAGISGNGANIYAIASAEANRPTVEIKGANITNGNASSGTCGGVYISGNATLTMTAGSITGGTSKYGGGNIRTNGAACIVNISGGSVENGTVTAGDGGNLFSNTAATINITGGSFIGGTASGSGANVCITQASATSVMKNATISGGTTSKTSATVGATLYLSSGNFTEISGMTFVGGSAMGSGANAGGVLITTGSYTIKNSTFTGGSAYGNGGALCLTGTGTTTLENCTITGGIARYGANLFVGNGTVNLVKTNINKCGTGTLIYGGGVCVNGANAIVNMDADSVITNNNVMHGGNVAVQAGTFNLNGGTISAGKATRNSTTAPYGGNVLLIAGTFNMNSGTITGGIVQNTTADVGGNGGNIYVAGGEFILNNGTITLGAPGSANALKGPMNGGNVYVAGGKFTMNGGTVSEGTAKNSGGNFAIDAAEATIDINGGSIEGGEAPSGGSFWINNGTVTVDDATIDGGSATIGGNITFNAGSAAFTNCEILNGASTGNGGNIAVNGEGATFTGCEILNGVAGTKVTDSEGAIAKPSTDGRGGNLAIGANTTLTNCVIRNGESWSVSNPGGGNIYAVTADNIILDGCTITGGICYSIGGNICLHGNTTVMTIKGDSYINGGVSTNNWGGNIGYSNTATLKLEGDTVVDGKNSRCHKGAQYGNNIGFSAAGKLYVSGNAKIKNGDHDMDNEDYNRWSVSVVAATATAVPKIYLAGNGSIDTIWLRGQSSVALDNIVVLQEGWTGAAQIRTNFADYNKAVAPGETVYAAVTKEDGYTGTGSLKVTNNGGTGYITFVDAEGVLKVAGITGFKVFNKGTDDEYQVENGFGSLDAVVDAGYDYAKLYVGGTYDLSAKTDNFPIDMNNCVVTFNTNGYKLAAIDYRTDGHTVAKYTKITVDNDDNVVLLTQNPINNYQYLNVLGEDGKWTSNRVQVELTKVSIKTTKDGIYYTTKISANANAASALVDYGTAVSLLEMPTADFLDHLDTNGAMYTAFDLNKTGDFSIEARSALVTGILSDSEDAATNTARAQMDIYANSFVTAMVDGKEVKIMADETSKLSFEDIMVKLDNKIDELNTKQPEGFEKTIETAVEFYNKWSNVFGTWTKKNSTELLLPNLKAEAEKAA